MCGCSSTMARMASIETLGLPTKTHRRYLLLALELEDKEQKGTPVHDVG